MTTATMTRTAEEAFAAERHAYHSLRVAEVVEETADARSYLLEIPEHLREVYAYEAGQFLTFRVPWGELELTRCYSLASCPGVDAVHKVTVKRVDDGRISNWFHDRLQAGDSIDVLPPSGRFTLRDHGTPLLLFAGGSGITPIVSLIKRALRFTERSVRLLYANRNAASVIFGGELDELVQAFPERLRVTHSLDDRDGLVTRERVLAEVGSVVDGDAYVCGPSAFMDVVEHALKEVGYPRERIFIERFVSPTDPDRKVPGEAPKPVPGGAVPSELVCHWEGKRHLVPYQRGETILQAAQRAGIEPPYSCEEGYCSSCQARLITGSVDMPDQDCLSDEDIEDGQILACSAYPTSGDIELSWD